MPRIHRLLKLACAISLVSLAGIASGAAPSHHLLMVVQGGSGEHQADVIGYVKDGKVFEIPSQNYQKFVDTYFKGNRYTLYSSGKALGSATATGAWHDQDPCGPYEAALSADKSVTLDPDSWTLASDLDLKDPGYTRRPVTAAEKAAFLKLATRVYVRNTEAEAPYGEPRIYTLAAMQKDQQVLLVGSTRVQEPAPDADSVGNTDSLFLIAESTGTGQFRASLVWYNSGSENSGADRDFVDALDIDGDGIPEIVAQTTYYEGTGFTIYRKTARGWAELFDYQYGC